MDNIKDLYDLCETISKEIGEANDKIRNSGGKLTAGDIDYVDKLTHALKSIKTTIAMMESEGSYADGMNDYTRNGGSYRYSYARGRNVRRDNMGRYSNGYSRDSMVEKLHELMEDAPNDQIRQDIQRLISKAENL